MTRHEHEPRLIRHVYSTPALSADEVDLSFGLWDFPGDTTGGTAQRSITRHGEREAKDMYDAPLPSPKERKRIREEAGLTQQAMAHKLFVERTTVARWEQPSGYSHGKRLNGREPAGDLRQEYSGLLRDLERDGAL